MRLARNDRLASNFSISPKLPEKNAVLKVEDLEESVPSNCFPAVFWSVVMVEKLDLLEGGMSIPCYLRCAWYVSMGILKTEGVTGAKIPSARD